MKVARHLNGTAAELLKSETGEWEYDDPAEHEAALVLWDRCGVHLGDIDDWIESGKVSGPNVMPARAKLLRLVIDGKLGKAQNLGLRFRALAEQNQLAMAVLKLGRKRPTSRKPCKLPELIQLRMVAAHKKLVDNGQHYGARKKLAEDFSEMLKKEVSEDLVDDVLLRHGAKVRKRKPKGS